MQTTLPPELQNRVLVLDGQVYVSEELEHGPALLSFLSLCKRHGFPRHQTVAAERFQKLLAANNGSKTESAVQEMAVNLIRRAHELGASDIHIVDHGPFTSVDFRRLTMMQRHKQLMGDTGRSLITCLYQTMSTSAEAQFSPNKRQDGRIISKNFLPSAVHSVRLHTEPLDCPEAAQGTGTFLAMRLLYDNTLATGGLNDRLKMLGYSDNHIDLLDYLAQRSGLVLISGPTGSGKSTALKHIMECMAQDNPEKSFMSIEDPPEYPLERVYQARVSTDNDDRRGHQYRNAIAGAMRSDPDTLMLGEIRYPEAAMAAVDAAQTGHGVWSTIHANSAMGIVQRMLSMLHAANCPDPHEFLCDHTVLAGLVHQRLVPTLCPECKVSLGKLQELPADDPFRQSRLPDPVRNRLFRVADPDRISSICVRGAGCANCKDLGFNGLTVAAEVVAPDREMLAHLRAGNVEEAINHWRSKQHGQSYVDHALRHIEAGQADPRITEQRLGVPLNWAKAIEDSVLTGAELSQLAGTSYRENRNGR